MSIKRQSISQFFKVSLKAYGKLPFIHLISLASLGRNIKKIEVPMLPGQETLNTTQRRPLSLTQLKILCYANSLGAKTFRSASLRETCFIFYSTFVEELFICFI